MQNLKYRFGLLLLILGGFLTLESTGGDLLESIGYAAMFGGTAVGIYGLAQAGLLDEL